MKRRMPGILLGFIGLSFAIQAIYYFPRLPDRVASHFNIHGQPDAWMSKAGFTIGALVTFLFLSGVFFGLRILIPRNADMINVPNKAFWLSPERQGETIDFVQLWLGWYGCLTLVFVWIIVESVYQANLSRTPQLGTAFAWAMSTYGVMAAGFIVWLLVHFQRSGPQASASQA